MLFAGKSTFKSKWKQFGSLALDMSESRGNKTQGLLTDEFIPYRPDEILLS